MSTAAYSSASTNGRSLETTNGTSSNLSSSPSSTPDPYEDVQPAGSHSLVNGYSQVPYHMRNEEIVNHLYYAGFQTGNYADTILLVRQNSYRLHAIILSRSPYLAHLMSISSQPVGQRTVYVPLEQQPEITQEGFAIALGYLYSPISLSLIRPENARGVLAAGCLLGGMDDLCEYAYEACLRLITVDTIASWVEFIDNVPPRPDSPPINGLSPTSVFGSYAQRLRDRVFQYLVTDLPNVLGVNQQPSTEQESSQSSDGREVLLQIYSHVPFEIFKAAVESPSFQIGSDQARFKFAKEAIELRKCGIARGGAEETVVLAFGNFSGGSAVHITRKMRKRPLWKVNS